MAQPLDVEDLEPGCVLSEPVRKHESILYHKGRKLSVEDIVFLQQWRVPEVRVEPWSMPDDCRRN